MENIALPNYWKKIEIEDIEMNTSLFYFQRNMNRGQACIKNYKSHVFICKFNDLKELKENWMSINRYIAVDIQSKIEDTVEASNFYMCCFVSEKVDITTRTSIENNTFCAKKYIFEYNQFDLKELCKKVESKIFMLNIQTNSTNARKMKEIELKNFRVYEGTVRIDLSNDGNSPASLVVIYAKNGVGKTSLFDGVEYALTGEVERLLDLDKNQIEGAVYHNRNNANSKAYVEIGMSDNKKIHRSVGAVKINGNDIKKVPLGKTQGKDIINGKEEQAKQLILPHQKIDTFVSSLTPVQRYKSWVQGIEVFKDFQDKFLEAYNEEKNLQKELDKFREKRKSLEAEKKDLNLLKKETLKIQKLIKEYNKVNRKIELEELEDNSSVNTYDNLINKTNMFIREHEKNKRIISGELDDISQIEKYGVLNLKALFDNGEKIEEEIEKKTQEIIKIEKKFKLQKELNENEKNQVEFKTLLIPLNRILLYGLKDINDKSVYLKNSREQMVELNRNIDYCTNRIKELESSNSKMRVSIQRVENELQNQDKINKLNAIVKSQVKLKCDMEKANFTKIEIEKSNNQLSKELKKHNNLFEMLKKANIPRELSSLVQDDIKRVSEHFGIEIISEIEKLLNQYLINKKKLEEYQEKIKLAEKNDIEIEEIKKSVSNYLLKHIEICECPTCHTKFNDWNTLYQRIYSVQKDNKDYLKDGEKKVIEEISNLDKDYQLLYAKCNKLWEKKIEDYKKRKSEFEQNIYINKEKLDQYKNQLLEYQDEVEENKKILSDMEIDIKDISLEQAEKWIREYKELLISKKQTENEEIQKNENSVKNLRKSQDDSMKELRKLQEERRKIEDNPELMKMVNFLFEKDNDYNLVNERKILNDKLNDCINQSNKLKSQFNQINLIHTDCDILRKEIKEIRKKLVGIDIWKNRCSILSNISIDEVNSKKQMLEEKMNNLEFGIELLHQIKEENGARNYFTNHERIEKELSKINIKEKAKLEELDEKNETYKERKNILENELNEYFSQASINEIYKKIDPHSNMKNIEYELSFSDRDEPELSIKVKEDIDNTKEVCDEYRPEWYFSTAQLNTVAFSSFLSRALSIDNAPMNTILVDDPIGHFDDMNVLGFADLMRSILETSNFQIIISTHDEKVYRILERKLNPKYYKSCFICLPEDKNITRN